MSRPLTIMNLISDDGRTGAERLALDVSKGLKRRGHRSIWGCPSICDLTDEAGAVGLEIFPCDYSGNMDMGPLAAFMRYCRHKKIDAVIAHQSHGRHLLIAARLLGLKSKTVFMRHCISGSFSFIGALFHNLVVDMNIAVSNTVSNSLLRGGIRPNKITTAYGGVDIDKFETVPPERMAEARREYVRRSAPSIGIVARLGVEKKFRPDMPTMKRHEDVFKALSIMNRDFNLLVVGANTEKGVEQLKLVAEHYGLDPQKITFCGFHKDIAPFYRIMDLNILPSQEEGLGLALIEAMAAGAPCIGADSGGIREVISDGVDGLLFSPGDSEGLAKKISLLLDDKEMRSEMVSRAREKVKRVFNIDNTVAKIEEAVYGLIF